MISNLTIIALIILGSGATLGWCMYKALNKWQPMKTAPKDGLTKIIIYQGGQEWLAIWSKEYEEFIYSRDYHLVLPEKWRHVTKFD